MADEEITRQNQMSEEDIASQVNAIIDNISPHGDLVLPEDATPQLLLALSKEVINRKLPASREIIFDMHSSHLSEIPDGVFAGMNTKIIPMPPNLQTVGVGAFLGCPELCEFVIYSKLQKSTWEQLICALEASYKENPRTIVLMLSCDSDEEEVRWLTEVLKTSDIRGLMIDFCVVPFVPAKALSGCLSVSELCFSPQLRGIGRGAFSGCANLKRIRFIDKGIQRKQWRAIFTALKSYQLLDIMLPRGMSQEEFEDFAEELTASNMKSVNVYTDNTAVTQIPDGTFAGCAALRNITIMPAIRSVGAHAFDDCHALRGIYTAEGLSGDLWKQLVAATETLSGVRFVLPVGAKIQEAADLVSALRQSDARDIGVDLQQTDIKTIPDEFFADCWALGTVCLPYGVNKIGESVFKGCRNLNFVYSPQVLDETGWCEVLRATGDVFGVNIRVPDITDTEGLKPLSDALRKNSSTLVQIDMRGVNVRSIPDGTFADCKSVIKFLLPAKLEQIGQGAFLGCTNLSEAGVLLADMNDWYTDPDCTDKIPATRLSRVILKGGAVYKDKRIPPEIEKRILAKVGDESMGFTGK